MIEFCNQKMISHLWNKISQYLFVDLKIYADPIQPCTIILTKSMIAFYYCARIFTMVLYD